MDGEYRGGGRKKGGRGEGEEGEGGGGEGGRRERVGEGIKRDGFEEATTYGNHGIVFIVLVLAYHFEPFAQR